MREDFEDLDVVVHRRGSRYLAKIPQLGLYATGETLPKAIEALEAKKGSMLEELTAAGALNEIGLQASGPNAQTKVLPALALFSAKGAIVVVLVLAAVGYTRHAVQSEIEQFQAVKMGGARFWADFEANIERAADTASELPAEKKQALLNDIRIIVDRWRPFVRESERLFNDREAPTNGNP